MDGSRFDHIARELAHGASRRALIKSALGIGSAFAMRQTVADVEAARRPTPAPKPVTCPGQQSWDGSACVCPDGMTTCGPDCCPDGLAQCCDNACCYGACSGEERCCPSGQIVCDGVCLGPGRCCADSDCTALDDPDACVAGACADSACIETSRCGDEQQCCGNNVCIGTEAGACCTDDDCGERSRCDQESHTCECAPNCTDVTCGGDDGCGGVCLTGTCSNGRTCLNGACFKNCPSGTGDCPRQQCENCLCLTVWGGHVLCMDRTVSYGNCGIGGPCPAGTACSTEGRCRAPCCLG